jgi:hypothetical protein
LCNEQVQFFGIDPFVDEEMKIFLEQTVGVIFLEGGGG